MSNVIIYDPDSSIVENRVIEFISSVNTPDYENRQDVLINPNVSSLKNVHTYYWKVVSNQVVEMSSVEKNAINAYLKSKTYRERKYRVFSYNVKKQLTKIVFYDTDEGYGIYSGIAQQESFIYEGSNLIKKIINIFYYDGSIASSETIEYFNNDQNELIEKSS